MRWRALYYRLRGFKTIDEMMAEMTAGRRSSMSAKEMRYGHLLGIALLPKGLRYPQKGEIWEAIDDIKIEYMTDHHGEFTGGGEAILPRGEQVVCSSETE